MEEAQTLTKKHTFCSNFPAIHRDSQIISKFKPKIRIIHIFAPEIIKTDVANFRELVQRLTGKPSENGGCSNRRNNKKNPTSIPSREEPKPSKKNALIMADKMRDGCRGFVDQSRDRVKGEEGLMWNAENSGGFLERFADLEGFIQEFGGDLPLLPTLDAPNSHLLHGFEGTQLV
ncbi:hypothetical protein D8674_011275 [Pyrus ussuriensis x Pyrus communis]|uniref:VQ domain-containing protein n=1 Tax=Pyrus ussuriensis x Pyrus communis TaxID=2448454 RepID=A0A5N5FZ12_9ROSA|nr:hypothetical protein D8674_011275 [Pyrus ussuriensis x Pyrus communis]